MPGVIYAVLAYPFGSESRLYGVYSTLERAHEAQKAVEARLPSPKVAGVVAIETNLSPRPITYSGFVDD